MRHRTLAAMGLGLCAIGAAPAIKVAPVFPTGYDEAYRGYLAALPPGGRAMPWLAKLEGVASLPRPLTVAGQRVIYMFSCKEHACDTDNVSVFLPADRKQAKAVVRINGAQSLIGGAGPVEVACVRKISDSGGAAETC